MRSSANPYAGYRFPPDIIARAVWLYHRFCLSLRDVEDLLAERAVDQDGDVLDIRVRKRRDKRAAKRFFLKLLKALRYVPRVIVSDKLGSRRAARKEVLPTAMHRQGKW